MQFFKLEEMTNKKGVAEKIMPQILLGVITAFILVIVLIYSSKAIGSVIIKKSNIDCSNSKWWSDPRGLKEVLKEVDNGREGEFMFYNKDCSLVSFSLKLGLEGNKIEYPYVLPNEPQLCLCKIESKMCKPYDCYKFKNYEKINTDQLSTENLKSYVYLKFLKDGKTLRITPIASEEPPQPIIYEKKGTTQKTDPTNLINYLLIVFKDREIKSFIPIVKIKETGFLVPQGITKRDGFTKMFDVTLAKPPSYSQTEEDYLENYESIDPNLVKIAVITFNLTKENYQKLTQQEREKIALYYRKETELNKVRLSCTEQETTVLCQGILNAFSSNFAISISNEDTSLIEINDQSKIGSKCESFASGLVEIPQDKKIICSDEVCCAHPDTIAHLEYTKKFIDETNHIKITDAARTLDSQRNLFLEFLAGGAEACGPKDIENKYELEKKVPDISGDKQNKMAFARDWLLKNEPNTLKIIDELNQYVSCPHTQGKAIDVQLARGKLDADIMELRNLMCNAGWANYGVEWWHYEYKTKSYESAKQNNKCFFGEDRYSKIAAIVAPNYV